MTDWATVVISGGSVLLGGGLTIAGQYLADRRSSLRERETRREAFQVANFEIQRTALLELQELVLKLRDMCGKIVQSWKFRGDLPASYGNAQYWYQVRPVVDAQIRRSDKLAQIAVRAENPELTEEERIALGAELKVLMKEMEEANASPELELISQNMNQLSEATDRMRILSSRTVSEIVMASCDELMVALNNWVLSESSKEGEQYYENITTEVSHVLKEIGKVLRIGPFG